MFDAFPGRGFFNSVLLDAGLLSRPIAFMATPAGAMTAVVVANWWRGFPFFGVSYLAGMQAIPAELYEAAAVDGAPPWRRFWHVTLPGLKHVIIVTTLLTFIFTLNDFNIVYVMTRGGPVDSTRVLVYSIYQDAFQNFQFGFASAQAVILLLLVMSLTLIQFRFVERRVHYQ